MTEFEAMPYTVTMVERDNALGTMAVFRGPGISNMHMAKILPIQLLNDWAIKCLTEDKGTLNWTDTQGVHIAAMLNIAYQEGKRARSREIAELLKP